MDDLKVLSTGGLAFNGYDLLAVSETEEVAQRVRTRLLTLINSWEFEPRLGIPQIGDGSIRDNSLPRDKRVQMIRQYILATSGVRSLVVFTPIFDNENQGLRINYQALTVYNTVTDEEIVSL